MKNLLRILMLVSVLSTAPAWATTYWVSPSGGETVCDNVDGTSDPGVYMTTTQMMSSACGVAGDTIMFKAGTYTGSAPRFNLLVPSGSSINSKSKVLCEGNRTCILAWSTYYASSSSKAIVATLDTKNFQIGDRGQGFDVNCANADSQCVGIYNQLTSAAGVQTGMSIIGNKVRNHHADGIAHREQNLGAYYDGIYIAYNEVGPAASPEYTGNGNPHPIYNQSINAIVEHNHVETGDDRLVGQFALHCFHMCDGSIFRYNVALVHSPSRGFVASHGDVSRFAGTKVQFYGNVLRLVGGSSSQCILAYGNGTPMDVYNNTCDGDWAGFVQATFGGSHSTTIIKNNVSAGTNGVWSCTQNAGVCTISNNSTAVTAASHFVDAANENYSLLSTSTLIDAGTSGGPIACNGTCDRGAYEVPKWPTGAPSTGCSVESGDASTLRITTTNNQEPPIQFTNQTGFTARKNGANDVVTAATKVGDNQVNLTLTTAIAAGETVDFSYAQTGDFRDSSNRGGQNYDQEFPPVTNQGCTNNVAGAPSHTWTQDRAEAHYLRGSEASPVMIPHGAASTGAAENPSRLEVMVGGALRLRISVLCAVADCPAVGFFPYYSKNGGAYAVIPDAFGADNIAMCGASPDPDIPVNGTATTNQLSGGTGFVAGALVLSSNAIPTVDLDHTTNTKVENEYCIKFDFDASAVDFYDIRIYKQDGTALNAYTFTPRITLVGTAGGSGF